MATKVKPCSREVHKAIIADDDRWRDDTVAIPGYEGIVAHMDDGDGGRLLLRNCKKCSSTISRKMAG